MSENRFAAAFLIPGGLWLLLLFVVPLGILLAISFGTTDDLGNALYGWYPENYERVFDSIYLEVLAPVGGLCAGHGGRCARSWAIRSPTTSRSSEGAGRTC